MNFCDLHTHVLWELDDGADNVETTRAMLSRMHEDGITHVACTPHADPGYRPFDMGLYQKRLNEAQEWAKTALPGLVLLSGAEIMWTYHTVEALRKKQVPTLNGTHYALIEFAPRIPYPDLRGAIYKLSAIGITPVIAHAERMSCLLWHPKRAIQMKKELPVHFQMNAGVLLSKPGPVYKRYVNEMLDARAIDVLASDSHNMTLRPPILKEAHAQLVLRTDVAYADQCVCFTGVIR